MSSHGHVRVLIGRVAAILLVIGLASARPFQPLPDLTPTREASSPRPGGIETTPPPAVSVLVAAPVVVGGPVPLTPPALVVFRVLSSTPVSLPTARPACAVKSAPTILRV
jgi:hypothetical protein